MKFFFRVVAGIWKTLLGAFMCQTPVTAFLVVGWTYRLMQRTALKRWWNASKIEEPDFRGYCDGEESFFMQATYPNWILHNRFRPALSKKFQVSGRVGAKVRAVLSSVFGALWENGKIGVQAMFNIWVLTLLPSVLWNFGWYSGWDNSFNKGYEQHDTGATIAVLGIALFIGAMFYLPMAQARQAVTGEWQTFYQFGTVWTVIRARSLGVLLLACGYAIISVPVTFFKTMPYFFEQVFPQTYDMTDAELLQFSNSYFFWTGLIFFAGYIFLRMAAARIYAAGVLAALRDGSLNVDQLASTEVAVLAKLRLVDREATRERHMVIKAARAVTRPAWRLTLATALVVVWFSFAAQIFVSEFINYHPVRGWMNQPLIQLPWFEYIPDHLSSLK